MILIIVVLVLLFGGGGGILGVTVEVIGDRTLRSELRVPYRLGALSFAVTAWCTVRKPTKKLIIVSTGGKARTSAYNSIVDELLRWRLLA